ncbi:MAG TPA: DinB family protein [Abditibacteriaceae bacterium]|jgi:uncharacterized damage-inducible protein DinB|nr:DinB family protein [Abditibacteriaceae bacterium]
MEIEMLRRMAHYNRWMNEKLMATCSQLGDEARKQDRGAPFCSIHGLWNHLLVCDRLWLARFEYSKLPYSKLDHEICADWNDLQAERARTDDAIDAFVETLTLEKLRSMLRFTAVSNPQERELPLWITVQHFFNHQTHHRGQITALMEQAGLDCGVTDIAAMPQE